LFISNLADVPLANPSLESPWSVSTPRPLSSSNPPHAPWPGFVDFSCCLLAWP
jgi:hypothetical protein